MNFACGFKSDDHGCYQNAMGLFMRCEDESSQFNGTDYFLGVIQFYTEVEDEDERFRTLLTNFGIPDPQKYSHVFYEQEPGEKGKDWKLINEKSKELMLTYEQIFPYAGTYKALFNAVKFLGYSDLVFKEWYRLFDNNDKTRYVAIQNYDVSTGKAIDGILKKYGVEYGEYERYSKLNRLSMIYHLNRITDGKWEEYRDWNSGLTIETDVPLLEKVYKYRNDEVLSKLYSVKNWLERHILGVGCYISDINGECIVLERMKCQGYVTSTTIKDITNEGSLTPRGYAIDASGNFDGNTAVLKNSNTMIRCSLDEYAHMRYTDEQITKREYSKTEMYSSATFEDYVDFPIERFVKNVIEGQIGDEKVPIYVSSPLEVPVVFDEV